MVPSSSSDMIKQIISMFTRTSNNITKKPSLTTTTPPKAQLSQLHFHEYNQEKPSRHTKTSASNNKRTIATIVIIITTTTTMMMIITATTSTTKVLTSTMVPSSSSGMIKRTIAVLWWPLPLAPDQIIFWSRLQSTPNHILYVNIRSNNTSSVISWLPFWFEKPELFICNQIYIFHCEKLRSSWNPQLFTIVIWIRMENVQLLLWCASNIDMHEKPKIESIWSEVNFDSPGMCRISWNASFSVPSHRRHPHRCHCNHSDCVSSVISIVWTFWYFVLFCPILDPLFSRFDVSEPGEIIIMIIEIVMMMMIMSSS